jgi:hypothetical protein
MKTIATVSILMFFLVSCGKQDPSSSPVRRTDNIHHPAFDFAKWRTVFPIETFERKEGPHQFSSTKKGDPLDLWKATGTIISSPADLCEVELVRERVAKKRNLGRSVPVDTFIWRHGMPDKPYLTKIGGVPHREKSLPWPTDQKGKPYTFVAQFCFLDSRDIVSHKLPGDVMLVFFKDSNSYSGEPDDVRIEWASQTLKEPVSKNDCPKPGFPVPELAGEIYRCNEYPDSSEIFEQEGHNEAYLLAASQSTKIGRETFVIQNDPRKRGQEFICALNSVQPSKKWPFTNMEQFPPSEQKVDEHYGWGLYEMMFGDVGCMYFMIDKRGNVTWASDCY